MRGRRRRGRRRRGRRRRVYGVGENERTILYFIHDGNGIINQSNTFFTSVSQVNNLKQNINSKQIIRERNRQTDIDGDRVFSTHLDIQALLLILILCCSFLLCCEHETRPAGRSNISVTVMSTPPDRASESEKKIEPVRKHQGSRTTWVKNYICVLFCERLGIEQNECCQNGISADCSVSRISVMQLSRIM